MVRQFILFGCNENSSAHIHVYLLGQSRKMLDLEDCDSIQELKSRLRSYLNQHKQNKWILGGGN